MLLGCIIFQIKKANRNDGAEKIFIFENGVYNLSNFVTQKTKLNLLNNKTARCEIVLIYLVSDKRTFCISKRVNCTIVCFAISLQSFSL